MRASLIHPSPTLRVQFFFTGGREYNFFLSICVCVRVCAACVCECATMGGSVGEGGVKEREDRFILVGQILDDNVDITAIALHES